MPSPGIITAAKSCDDTPYYTNSSHLPVGYTEDIFSALDVQDELQTLYTSGTVFHAFLGEKLPDWKAAADLVRKIAENYKLPYYTMSPTYSVCKTHGYLAGEVSVCPECGQPTEVYSRITGYYRPVQNWNDGKVQEFKDRRTYDIGASRLIKKRSDAEEEQKKESFAEEIREAAEEQAAALAEEAIETPESALPPVMEGAGIKLFATTTCPNCKIVAAQMDKMGLNYEKIYGNVDIDKAREYGIRQAPTLIVEDAEGQHRYTGVQEIKKFLAEAGK